MDYYNKVYREDPLTKERTMVYSTDPRDTEDGIIHSMTDKPTTHDEFYDKLHAYLLDHNQQELAGHLDTLWQELSKARKTITEHEPQKQIEAEATTDDDTGAGGWGFKKK